MNVDMISGFKFLHLAHNSGQRLHNICSRIITEIRKNFWFLVPIFESNFQLQLVLDWRLKNDHPFIVSSSNFQHTFLITKGPIVSVE